jgi:hypothetical protein
MLRLGGIFGLSGCRTGANGSRHLSSICPATATNDASYNFAVWSDFFVPATDALARSGMKRFQVKTRGGAAGKMRATKLSGIRDDKDPKEVVRENPVPQPPQSVRDNRPQGLGRSVQIPSHFYRFRYLVFSFELFPTNSICRGAV